MSASTRSSGRGCFDWALELSHLETDPRYAKGYWRYTNREELMVLIEAAFRSKPASHWLERLREADHPAAIVQGYEEIVKDEQAWANDYFVQQEHPVFGKQTVVGLHIQMSETPGRVGAPPPTLGADTLEVLLSAGLSGERLDQLIAAGIITPAREATPAHLSPVPHACAHALQGRSR